MLSSCSYCQESDFDDDDRDSDTHILHHNRSSLPFKLRPSPPFPFPPLVLHPLTPFVLDFILPKLKRKYKKDVKKEEEEFEVVRRKARQPRHLKYVREDRSVKLCSYPYRHISPLINDCLHSICLLICTLNIVSSRAPFNSSSLAPTMSLTILLS